MTWYTAYYGSYRNGDTMHHIDGTFNRKQIFDKARKIASDTGRTVCIKAEKGMKLKFYDVKPE